MKSSSRTYDNNFSVTTLLKNTPKINGVFFMRMKDKVLGKKYDLSLVFISGPYSKKLNGLYRKKRRPTDILSFALAKNEGEIFIAPTEVRKKARDFKRTETNFTSYLFIHGLCHLKGMRHGSRMDSEEKKYRKLFKI